MRRAAVTAAHEAEVEQDLQAKRDNEATQVAERLAKMTLVEGGVIAGLQRLSGAGVQLNPLRVLAL